MKSWGINQLTLFVNIKDLIFDYFNLFNLFENSDKIFQASQSYLSIVFLQFRLRIDLKNLYLFKFVFCIISVVWLLCVYQVKQSFCFQKYRLRKVFSKSSSFSIGFFTVLLILIKSMLLFHYWKELGVFHHNLTFFLKKTCFIPNLPPLYFLIFQILHI